MSSSSSKSYFIQNIILSILFIFTCFIGHAQKLTQENGLNTVEFKTPEGTIYAYLPNKYVTNQQISGTVISRPEGNSEKQLKKNLKKLSSYVLHIGSTSAKITNPIYSLTMDENPSVELQLKDAKGILLGQQPVQLENVPKTNQISFPKTLVSENRSQIYGDFDGDISTTNLKIGDNAVQILAESPVQTLFQAPTIDIAPTEMVLIENDVKYTADVQVVGMEFTADKLDLMKGEGTFIRITVFGLSTVEEPVDFVLDNVSIPVITLQGGNHQEMVFYPGEQETFSKSWRIQSLKSGGFNLVAKLTVPEPPFLGDVDDANEPSFLDDSTMDIANCEEGTTRAKQGAATKTCIWNIPTHPEISFSSDRDGEYAEEGVENFLSSLSTIFGAFDNLMNMKLDQAVSHVAKIPTSPMGYASSITEIGDKAVKAAAKWAEENNAKVMEINAVVRMQEIHIECGQIEICKAGVWVDGGVSPVDRPKLVKIVKRNWTSDATRYKGMEFPQKMRMMTDWFKDLAKDADAFAKNACGCESDKPKVATGGLKNVKKDQLKKKSCDPIREKIRKTKEGIAYAESEIEKAKGRIDAEKKKLEQMKIDWEIAKTAAESKITAAEKEVVLAEAAWDNLISNAGSYSENAYKKKGDEVIARQDKAKSSLKAARDALKEINKKFENDIMTSELLIIEDQKLITISQEYIVNQKKELAILEGQLKDCLRTGGI
jgi:hypothetical protein